MRCSSLWRRSISCRLSCPAQVSKAPSGLTEVQPLCLPKSRFRHPATAWYQRHLEN